MEAIDRKTEQSKEKASFEKIDRKRSTNKATPSLIKSTGTAN